MGIAIEGALQVQLLAEDKIKEFVIILIEQVCKDSSENVSVAIGDAGIWNIPQPSIREHKSRHASTLYVAFDATGYVRYAVPSMGDPSLSVYCVPVPANTCSKAELVR